jgi:hypothetical protein
MRLVAALAACACFSACHRQPDLSRLGPPSQRLVGHWMTNSGDHEYYGPVDASGLGSFILVHADGKPVEQQYRVLEEDPGTQMVRVSLLSAGGAATEQTNVISEDGESATATATILGDKVTLAFARMDDAVAPKRPRAVEPEPSATIAGKYIRTRTASPVPGFPADMPDGQYHRVLVRYDGMKPVYKWEPLTARDKTPIGVMFSPSRAVAQRQSYLIWLHATAAGILLIISLLFASELGATTLLTGWAVALAIGGIGVFLLDVPLLAGVLEILTGGVLVFKAMFQKSDLLS